MRRFTLFLFFLFCLPAISNAQEPVAGEVAPAATAWVMTSSALVLMMTLPGLALFYGCLLYTSPSPRDATLSRMPSSA